MQKEMLQLVELVKNPDSYFLIDVRDPEDFEKYHVTHTINIPLIQLPQRLTEIPKDRIPVTICGKGGGRSTEGALLLRQKGFTDALWLEGGTTGWINSQVNAM